MSSDVIKSRGIQNSYQNAPEPRTFVNVSSLLKISSFGRSEADLLGVK